MLQQELDRLEHKVNASWEKIDADHVNSFKMNEVTRALIDQLELEFHLALNQIANEVEFTTEAEELAIITARNVARAKYIEYVIELLRNPESDEMREFKDVDTMRTSGNN